MRILLDGNVSKERFLQLLELNHEEESLDFKRDLDFKARNKITQKSKINLVCDCVSIANTYGGYLIFGVEELQNEQFQFVGTSKETAQYLTSDRVSNLIKSYVAGNISIKSNCIKLENGLGVIIFIGKARIKMPFVKDGQYYENERQMTKFREGDLFVRHSTNTEKARYEDYETMIEEIRKEERLRIGLDKPNSNLESKVDELIGVISGQPRKFDVNNLFNLNFADIEDTFYHFLTNEERLRRRKRAVRTIFELIKLEIFKLESLNNLKELNSGISSLAELFLNRLYPLYESIKNTDFRELEYMFFDNLYALYCLSFKLNGIFLEKPSHANFLQIKIVEIFYNLGAIYLETSTNYKYFERFILRDSKPVDSNFQNKYSNDLPWLTYCSEIYKLYNLQGQPSILHFIYTENKDNDYLIDLFEIPDNYLKNLVVFDFFCNFYSVLNKKESVPNYKLFPIEMINDEVRYHLISSTWVKEYHNTIAKVLIQLLGTRSQKENLSWNKNMDKEIIEFIEKNK